MTIKELIEKLSAFAPDETILIPGTGRDEGAYVTIAAIGKHPVWKCYENHAFTTTDIGNVDNQPDGYAVILDTGD